MGVGWVCDVVVNPISLQWSLNVSQLIAPRLRMYCYSSINLSQLLAAWAQRLVLEAHAVRLSDAGR